MTSYICVNIGCSSFSIHWNIGCSDWRLLAETCNYRNSSFETLFSLSLSLSLFTDERHQQLAVVRHHSWNQIEKKRLYSPRVIFLSFVLFFNPLLCLPNSIYLNITWHWEATKERQRGELHRRPPAKERRLKKRSSNEPSLDQEGV